MVASRALCVWTTPRSGPTGCVTTASAGPRGSWTTAATSRVTSRAAASPSTATGPTPTCKATAPSCATTCANDPTDASELAATKQLGPGRCALGHPTSEHDLAAGFMPRVVAVSIVSAPWTRPTNVGMAASEVTAERRVTAPHQTRLLILPALGLELFAEPRHHPCHERAPVGVSADSMVFL